jgi:hypothetical protein
MSSVSVSFQESLPREIDVSPLVAHGPPSRFPRILYKLPYDVSTSWYGTIWPQRVINRQTVHHSWSLFERSRGAHPADAYGDKFRYDECLRSSGPISALFVGFSICLFVVAILISPVRWADQQRVAGWLIHLKLDTLGAEADIASIWHRTCL